MPVVTTAEYVVMVPGLRHGPAFFWPDPDTILPAFHVRIWPDPACLARGFLRSTQWLVKGDVHRAKPNSITSWSSACRTGCAAAIAVRIRPARRGAAG